MPIQADSPESKPLRSTEVMTGLRILLLLDYKLSYLGGAQTAFRQQASALAEAGHIVTVIAPGASTDLALRRAGVATFDVTTRIVIPGLELPVIANSQRLRLWLKDRMATDRIDLVIAHSEFGLTAAAFQVAAALGIPTMHTVHTFFWRGPRAVGFAAPLVSVLHHHLTGLPATRQTLAAHPLDSSLRGMTLAAGRAADLVISPSHHQASALRAAGLHHIAVISNTCATTTTSPPVPSAVGPLRLVWAGRFAPEKRLSVVLEAMTLVERRLGPDAVLLDVAGGIVRARIPGSVTFHGQVSPAEVLALLGTAHSAVITSNGYDNQPMIAIEAFRAGRPIIVSDPTLAGEFGRAAIGASDTTATGLAETIVRLAQNRDLLRRPTAAANRYAADTTPQRHADQVVAAHDALCRVAMMRAA